MTHRHPENQEDTKIDFRYARDIEGIDFNVIYLYRILEEKNLKNKTIVLDDEFSTAPDIIRPREWVAIMYSFFDDLVNRALINDAQFSKDSLQVAISSTNPKRFETTFNYKRSGVVAISSTTAFAGFNFGS